MSTFYIDPGNGCDTHNGTIGNQPWKSFVPLESLILGPGDRIVVVAPGTFKTSLVIHGHGTANAPIEVVFAPGRYDFYTQSGAMRGYHISNNNDQPDIPKHLGILIENASHIAIHGNGARLVCRNKMIVVCIDHSEEVTIRDLQVDYHRPTVSEFTVVSATENAADLRIHPDSWHTIADGKITWLGEGWSHDTGLAQELIPETGSIWRRKDPLQGMRLEAMEPGVMRAHGKHSMIPGRVFQLRETYRDCVGIFVRGSKAVTFVNLDLLYLHGMGIVGQFSEDITLDKVRMAPEASSGRTCSVWADSTHFSGCRGQITYRECVFDGAHDDAINVHGTYLQIQEVLSSTSVRLRFMHRQTYGFMAFNPGDEVDFVRWDSMESFGSSKVTDARMINPFEIVVTLEQQVPDGLRVQDVLENTSWTPAVEITGCTIKRIPTRGFLLTSRQKVLVQGNRFVRIHSNGINIEADSSNWFESGCVRDMRILDNRFEECGKEAILITPRQRIPNPSVHQNIQIRGNTFVLPESGTAVKAAGTSNLVIADNVIELTTDPYQRSIMVTNDCNAVNLANNSFQRVS